MRNSLATLLIATLLLSCATRAPEVSAQERAIAGATKEAQSLFGWKKTTVSYAEFSDGVWSVMLCRVPELPGGFVVFKVTSEGNVVGWRGGS